MASIKTISLHTDVINHCGHIKTISECQMKVTTKQVLSVDLSPVSMKP